MAGIFKAYDIRGMYPGEVNEDLARAIGGAYAALIGGGSACVGRDMREHSVPLQEAFIAGMNGAGMNAINLGMVSTPAVYFATAHLGCEGGVQVTASHNPAEYNGFKMCREEAIPISSDTGIEDIERRVAENDLPGARRAGSVQQRDLREEYFAHVLSFLTAGEPRLRVAVDCGNGMGGWYADLFQRLGCEVIGLYFDLDGTFPNHEANPLLPENLVDLQAAVREHGADLGVAFDGDADRAAFVDETGRAIPCDLMTLLLALDALEENPGARIVYDLRSSRAVPEIIRENGGVPVRERVGHSFMKATMREGDCLFGGEVSGHFYFKDNFYADSGAIALVKTLGMLRRRREAISSLLDPLRVYRKPPESSYRVPDKEEALHRLKEKFADGKQDFLDGVTVEYDDWWFNARPSNTEPLLRLNIEARTDELLEEKLAQVRAVLEGGKG